jgi:hypothetical protein
MSGESEFSKESTEAGVYTAIWQIPGLGEEDWIREIFGSSLGRWIIDTEHKVVGDRVILFDRHCNAKDPAYYAKFRGRDAFLMDLTDENYDFRPELYSNFRGVFRFYWSDVFQTNTVHFLPLGYTHTLAVPKKPLVEASQRQYVWSFLGQINKSSRPEMIQAMTRLEPHLFFATDEMPGITMWNRNDKGQRYYSPTQNTEIMVDSIFAPCPMGNVNLECYRIYEALECGAIPIVEKRMTLDYFGGLWGEHPIPTVSSWSDARKLVHNILSRPEELNLLQARCLQWWKWYKHQLSQGVEDFISRRSIDPQLLVVRDIVLPKYELPGWKLVELLRHHDRHALLRRFKRQARRLLIDRKLRISSSGKDHKYP